MSERQKDIAIERVYLNSYKENCVLESIRYRNVETDAGTDRE